jgi:hypothetical protein
LQILDLRGIAARLPLEVLKTFPILARASNEPAGLTSPDRALNT